MKRTFLFLLVFLMATMFSRAAWINKGDYYESDFKIPEKANSLVISRDQKQIFVFGDSTISRYDAASGSLIKTYNKVVKNGFTTSYSKDLKSYVLTQYTDQHYQDSVNPYNLTFQIYDIETDSLIREFNKLIGYEGNYSFSLSFGGLTSTFSSEIFSLSGDYNFSEQKFYFFMRFHCEVYCSSPGFENKESGVWQVFQLTNTNVNPIFEAVDVFGYHILNDSNILVGLLNVDLYDPPYYPANTTSTYGIALVDPLFNQKFKEGLSRYDIIKTSSNSKYYTTNNYIYSIYDSNLVKRIDSKDVAVFSDGCVAALYPANEKVNDSTNRYYSKVNLSFISADANKNITVDSLTVDGKYLTKIESLNDTTLVIAGDTTSLVIYRSHILSSYHFQAVAEKDSLYIGDSASFYNCGNTPESIYWDFGDGTYSNEAHPKHVYSNTGRYQVILTCTKDNIQYKDTLAVEVIKLVADFSVNTTKGSAPLTVNFTNLSTGNPQAYLWSFDDGESSIEKNPTHIFNKSGYFSVSLKITSGNYSVIVKKQFLINVDVNDYEIADCNVDIQKKLDGDNTLQLGDYHIFDKDYLSLFTCASKDEYIGGTGNVHTKYKIYSVYDYYKDGVCFCYDQYYYSVSDNDPQVFYQTAVVRDTNKEVFLLDCITNPYNCRVESLKNAEFSIIYDTLALKYTDTLQIETAPNIMRFDAFFNKNNNIVYAYKCNGGGFIFREIDVAHKKLEFTTERMNGNLLSFALFKSKYPVLLYNDTNGIIKLAKYDSLNNLSWTQTISNDSVSFNKIICTKNNIIALGAKNGCGYWQAFNLAGATTASASKTNTGWISFTCGQAEFDSLIVISGAYCNDPGFLIYSDNGALLHETKLACHTPGYVSALAINFDSNTVNLLDGSSNTSVVVNRIKLPYYGVNGDFEFFNSMQDTSGKGKIVHSGISINDIYPNPASTDLLNISINMENAGEIKLIIYDSFGEEVKRVYSGAVHSGTSIFQASIEDLSEGYYYLYLSNGSHTKTTPIVKIK